MSRLPKHGPISTCAAPSPPPPRNSPADYDAKLERRRESMKWMNREFLSIYLAIEESRSSRGTDEKVFHELIEYL